MKSVNRYFSFYIYLYFPFSLFSFAFWWCLSNSVNRKFLTWTSPCLISKLRTWRINTRAQRSSSWQKHIVSAERHHGCWSALWPPTKTKQRNLSKHPWTRCGACGSSCLQAAALHQASQLPSSKDFKRPMSILGSSGFSQSNLGSESTKNLLWKYAFLQKERMSSISISFSSEISIQFEY